MDVPVEILVETTMDVPREILVEAYAKKIIMI